MRLIKRVVVAAVFITSLVMQTGVHAATEPTEVTFSGIVKRHSLSNPDVRISGTVHIRFAKKSSDGPDSDVLVPFTIRAGAYQTTYSQTVPWSLVDNTGDEYRRLGYFRIEVSCTSGCDEAGLLNNIVQYYGESQEMYLPEREDDINAERFGLDDRQSFYNVNLTLLPSDGYFSGRVALPNGMKAQSDIELKIVALEQRGYVRDILFVVLENPITIEAGQSSVAFRLKNLGQTSSEFFINSDGERRTSGGIHNRTIFGYFCESLGCEQHGLARQGWLENGSNKLITVRNPFTVVSDSHFMYSEKSFNIVVPGVIELLAIGDQKATVILDRSESDQATKVQIEGRLIAEQSRVNVLCDQHGPISSKSNEAWPCWLFDLMESTVEVVSETPFIMEAGQKQARLAVPMNSMRQPLEPEEFIYQYSGISIDEQRIKFVCDKGCDAFPHAKEGYYVSDTERFARNSVNSAAHFVKTQDFAGKNFVMSVLRPPLIVPMIDLVLDEED